MEPTSRVTSTANTTVVLRRFQRGISGPLIDQTNPDPARIVATRPKRPATRGTTSHHALKYSTTSNANSESALATTSPIRATPRALLLTLLLPSSIFPTTKTDGRIARAGLANIAQTTPASPPIITRRDCPRIARAIVWGVQVRGFTPVCQKSPQTPPARPRNGVKKIPGQKGPWDPVTV